MKTPPIPDRLLRYLGVGALATLGHFALFACLLLVLAPWGASVVAAAGGALVSFWGSRRACFPARGNRSLQPRRFVCVTLLHNGANAVTMWLLLEYFTLGAWPAQALSTLVLTLLGYFAHRYWTYNDVDIFSLSQAARNR